MQPTQGGDAFARRRPSKLRLERLPPSQHLGEPRRLGEGQWQQRLRFTGEAMAEPGHEEALSNLLNLLGQRNGACTRLSLE